MRYKVDVYRTAYASRTIEVEAESEDEAIEKALDTAGNYYFSENNAEYEAEYAELVEEDV